MEVEHWPPRDTCYFIVSPNPLFATEGVAHTQDGVTLHYFRIKFGDGSHLTPGRYNTCNADFYSKDNVRNLEGFYSTPDKEHETGNSLRRCGKFLERMILQTIGYTIQPGVTVAPLEQISNVGGNETEWYRIWARPGEEVKELGEFLVQLADEFPNASLGLKAAVPEVLVKFKVSDAAGYNKLNLDRQKLFKEALGNACVDEAMEYVQGKGGDERSGVIYRLASKSRTFQNP